MPKRIIISIFDDAFMHYAIPMFMSVRAQHPDIPCVAGDLGLSSHSKRVLGLMGVQVLETKRVDVLKKNKLALNYSDFLIAPFLEDNKVEYDEVVWIDADTMILKPLDEVWSYDVDVVGHPGRGVHGPIWTLKERSRYHSSDKQMDWIKKHLNVGLDTPYFATGLWWTRSKKLLHELNAVLDRIVNMGVDSPMFTAIVASMKIPFKQLDPETWNFSRHLVDKAEYVNGEIAHGSVKPNTIGFSRVAGGNRLGCPAADRFLEEHVMPTFLAVNGDTQMKANKIRAFAQIACKARERGIYGCLVEAGVWRGASASVLAHVFREEARLLYLFDSFEGMPEPTVEDKSGKRFLPKGALSNTSQAYVDGVLGRVFTMNDPLHNIMTSIHKGFITKPADLADYVKGSIAFLHIDLDNYMPYVIALEALYKDVVKGGFIVFDDYGYFEGARKAVDEWVAKTGEALIDADGTSRRVVIKGGGTL